jgi:hypothetical protein
MTRRALAVLASIPLVSLVSIPAPALAADPAASPESVYAPPEPPKPEDGTNMGGAHFDLGISYFSDYIYRGVRVFEAQGGNNGLNLQIDSKLSFDLGKLPHPYVSVFTNIANSDPTSNFEEIRPSVGFDWAIKPLVFSAGYTTYLYPERDERETSEVFAGLSMDDRVLFGGKPVPVPYVLLAYDFDLYDGFYLETGLSYKLNFEDYGLTLTATANVAYINRYRAYIPGDNNGPSEPGFFTDPDHYDGSKHLSGMQHYQVGLMAEYSLNKVFNVSARYGEWTLRGYINYTDGLDDSISATTRLWGGGGINFSY